MNAVVAPRRLGLARRGERRPLLFVSGPGAGARRYRCDHPAEQLAEAGVQADVCYRADVRLAALADRYDCVVLYRVPWDDDVGRLIERAQAAGSVVVCDFDDLVFDPERAGSIRALDALEPGARAAHVEGIERQRRTLAACGAAVVSTDPLREAASEFAARVHVLPNVVSAEMIRQADAARATARARHAVRVGYLSGTPTHDRDFEEAADALVWALGRYDALELVVVGFLDLDQRFVGKRVQRVPYQPWEQLPQLIASLDVNLAPLEVGNAFTAAKSCLKFLEAGVVGVTTIASPRPDFVRVIEHGANGLLADGVGDWRTALSLLIEDAEERRRLGRRARSDILARHTTHATAHDAAAVFESLAGGLR